MDLVAELKSLRELKGVSQSTVAEAIGCDQGAVSHWETGKSQPSGSARKLLETLIADMRKLPDAPSKREVAA